ncbi:MAG: hypothetical protein ACJ788_24450 [Ktedonobacteraceae bacterium]
MGWFGKKHEEPAPKQEPDEPNYVQQRLDEMNRLESNWHPKAPTASKAIIGHKVNEIQRELLHESGVIPVVDQKTGKWKLFS